LAEAFTVFPGEAARAGTTDITNSITARKAATIVFHFIVVRLRDCFLITQVPPLSLKMGIHQIY
jgi:hypothetical protein